jgi:hypothetical protein
LRCAGRNRAADDPARAAGSMPVRRAIRAAESKSVRPCEVPDIGRGLPPALAGWFTGNGVCGRLGDGTRYGVARGSRRETNNSRFAACPHSCGIYPRPEAPVTSAAEVSDARRNNCRPMARRRRGACRLWPYDSRLRSPARWERLVLVLVALPAAQQRPEAYADDRPAGVLGAQRGAGFHPGPQAAARPPQPCCR